MAYIPETTINTIAQYIANSRELCGDEQAAASMGCDDYNVPQADRRRVIRVAFFRAKAIWRNYQAQAGVSSDYWVY